MNGKVILIIVVALVLVFAIIGVSGCNSLISAEEDIDAAYANIQTALQRRADLIPNLVETVKGYAAHEEEIFTAIADARAAMMSASNVEEAAEADAAMNSALSRLLAISEAYPELKANQNFIDLQTQLEGTENRISTERIKYNEAVQNFNTKIRRFPGSIYASMMGMEKAEYFEASDSAQNVPTVDFGE